MSNAITAVFHYIIPFWIAVIAVVAVLCSSCSDDCTNDETKCEGNRVLYCVDGDWIEDNNCHTITLMTGAQLPGQCCVENNEAWCVEKGTCDENNQ